MDSDRIITLDVISERRIITCFRGLLCCKKRRHTYTYTSQRKKFGLIVQDTGGEQNHDPAEGIGIQWTISETGRDVLR